MNCGHEKRFARRIEAIFPGCKIFDETIHVKMTFSSRFPGKQTDLRRQIRHGINDNRPVHQFCAFALTVSCTSRRGRIHGSMRASSPLKPRAAVAAASREEKRP